MISPWESPRPTVRSRGRLYFRADLLGTPGAAAPENLRRNSRGPFLQVCNSDKTSLKQVRACRKGPYCDFIIQMDVWVLLTMAGSDSISTHTKPD